MIFIKNKKGADKLISIYWFLILTIIAGGIVMMVNGYYSSPYDVREAECEILGAKLANCIYPSGVVHPDFISVQGKYKPEFIDNFESYCSLNIKSADEFEDDQYYGKISIYNTEKKKNLDKEIIIGNFDFEADCLTEDVSRNQATCVEKEFYMVLPGDRLKFVTILTAIGKTKQNA